MKKLLVPLVVAFAVLAATMAARYFLIQPPELAHQCDAGTGPWWCTLRLAFILTYARYELGYLALAGALALTIWRNRLIAGTTLSIGIAAIVLYCYEPGAVAIVAATLVLARIATGGAEAGARQTT